MVIFRIVGLVLIVVALMLLGADVVSTLEKGGETVIRSLDQILLLLGVDANAWAQRQSSPALSGAFSMILSWPGWAVLGFPGALLGMIASGPRGTRHTLPAPRPSPLPPRAPSPPPPPTANP